MIQGRGRGGRGEGGKGEEEEDGGLRMEIEWLVASEELRRGGYLERIEWRGEKRGEGG